VQAFRYEGDDAGLSLLAMITAFKIREMMTARRRQNSLSPRPERKAR
jgi:hypothetical protein